ncbi:MAG: family 20 glycosylhydrolase [Clostridia bacterium]|nr:family 20 glycosylhydrolase [Clostridia bacterium]
MGKRSFLNRSIPVVLLTAVLLLTSLPCFAQTPEGSVWRLSDDTSIVLMTSAEYSFIDPALTAQLQLFSEELAQKITKSPLPVIDGSVKTAGKHDLCLLLDSRLSVPAEGYRITVSGGRAIVSASDADGLFYGCRDIIKQLLLSGAVSGTESSPDVAERSVSLDCGRKYYTVDWIKQLIREMSWNNMNALALHLSEEMGFGIESKTYPWLAGRDGTLGTQAEAVTDSRYLTQEEVAEIVRYAELYHVEIIPSLDSPGHLNYLVKRFNEQCAQKDYSFNYGGKTYTAAAGSEIGNYFHYNGQTAIVQGSRNKAYSMGIDLANETAVAFVKSLIEEYAVFFRSLGCTKFDIGGDELLGWGASIDWTVSKWKQLDHWKEYAQNRAKAEGRANSADAVAYDAFMYYMNDLYDLVTGLGYTSVRMWNDDALRSADTGWKRVVELNPKIEIWYWTTGANTVQDYVNAGHRVYNILCDYNYYALTFDFFKETRSLFTKSYADRIYSEWSPYVFAPDGSDDLPCGHEAVLGSAFAVWCDHPDLRTEAEVMADILPMLRAHAAKAWDSDVSAKRTYAEFAEIMQNLGDAPDVNLQIP